MPYDLKVQFAWEMIMRRHGKHYADRCIFGGDVQNYAFSHPAATVREIVRYARGRAS